MASVETKTGAATMKTDDPTPIRERVANWLALLALLLVGVVWPPVFGAVPDGEAPGNARAGSLFLCAMPCGEPIQALRQSTQIRAQVTGNVARVHVSQKFENPSDDWVEGLYVFPLSAGAAVDELQMLVGERRIRGEIQRKEEARATFERAKSEGRRASLVDQERPNMFTTSVANIAPHSSITVEIAYLDTISFRDGRYSLSLPLSITPRYTPGTALDPADPNASANAREANEVAAVSPTATPERVTGTVQTAQIEIELVPGFPIESLQSLNHDRSGGSRFRAGLEAGRYA
jgi:Ca-activated chloride channel homolog